MLRDCPRWGFFPLGQNAAFLLLPMLAMLLETLPTPGCGAPFRGSRGAIRKVATQINAPSSDRDWCWSLRTGMHLNCSEGRDAGGLVCRGAVWCLDGRTIDAVSCPHGQTFSAKGLTCEDLPLPAGGEIVPPPGRQVWRRLSDRDKSAQRPRIPWAEVTALKMFQDSVVDPGGAMASWVIPRAVNPTGLPFYCTWAGVTCNPDTLSVTSLVLNNLDSFQCLWAKTRGVQGSSTTAGGGAVQSIPPEFGSLTALEVLDLGNNGMCGDTFLGSVSLGGLQGPLPAELGLCTSLTVISLQYNQLSGSLPESLSNLKRLQSLGLTYNQFSGSIAAGLSSMQDLISLSLDHNNFTGTIPASLSKLTKLQSLKLGFLPLSGTIPAELGSLASLTYLQLSNVPMLEGTIPEALSKLTSLVLLVVEATGVHGRFPAWTVGLSALTELRLRNCNFSGQLPQTRWPTTLDSLDLSGNQFSGPIPGTGLCNSTGSTPALVSLDLSGNKFSGGTPLAVSSCTSLNNLRLGHNELEGHFPEKPFFVSLNYLSLFDVSYNGLTGLMPDVLSTQTNMKNVWVQGNQLRGPLPQLPCSDSIAGIEFNASRNFFQGTLQNLLPAKCDSRGEVSVDVSYNRLTGGIPSNFFEFNVTGLWAQGNQLSGLLPLPLPSPRRLFFPGLFTLNLAQNSFTGPIPSVLLYGLSTLTALDLSHNELQAELPVALHQAPRKGAPNGTLAALKLNNLALQGNSLTGSIPASLAELTLLTALNLSHNQLSGSLPASIAIESLVSLDVSGNKLTGGVPTELSSSSFLGTLNVSQNLLTDPIPAQLAPTFLPWLQQLDFSRNSITGDIPYSMTVKPQQNVTLSFAYNNLTGQVPSSADGWFPFSAQDLAGNPFLCGGGTKLTPWTPSCNPAAPPTPSPFTPGVIAAIAVSALVALALIVGASWWALRPRDEWTTGVFLVFQPQTDPPFNARTLVESTGMFSEESTLGRGGFGSVYRAELPDGTPVAMKRLAAGSDQGDDEFKAELQFLGSLSHRNLVQLIAAYVGTPPANERLLIYEMVSGGSLDNILENIPKGSPYATLDLRLSIGLDVARGLRYLHTEAHPPIIHRDMKPANVLMDSELVARVADFGLAKEAALDVTHMTTEIFGTVGYLSPEYSNFGRCSAKSDVYAFGVTMLQLITGKRPSDDECAEKGLQRWVSKQGLEGAMDPALELSGKDDMNRARAFLKISIQCIARIPVDRPTMEEVVHYLENLDIIAVGIQQSSAPAE